MPSAQHVSSVNVKFFEFTRARTRPATRRSPRAPAQSRRKGVWGTSDMYGTTHATSRGQGTTSWARYVLALLLTGSSRYAPEVPAAPGSIPSYAALYRGQGLPTSRPKRPSTPRERRRDDELGSGSRNAFLQNTMHLRQTSASVDGGGPRTPKLSEGQDLRRFRDCEFERAFSPAAPFEPPLVPE